MRKYDTLFSMNLTPDKHTLFLAPMADLTHGGFRLLVEHYGGCDLYYSEMIDARLYLTKGPLERYYDSILPDRERVIFQLVGAQEEELVSAAVELARLEPRGIDINMGCSAPHILQAGAGCALMAQREKASRIMDRLRKALPGHMSLSAKIRLGETENRESLIRFARSLEEAGADYIVLHPKIRKEKGSRPPRKEYIGILQRELTIPVIANGHIWSTGSYLSCWRQQQPSGTMLGRQAARQPWFFNRLKGVIAAEKGLCEMGTLKKIDLEECWDLFFENLMIHQPGEFHKSRARRFSLYFSENLAYGYQLHYSKITNSLHARDMNRIYKQYFKEHPGEKTLTYPEPEGSWPGA